MSKTVNTPKAPAAIGPYSQAVIAYEPINTMLVFTSGQIAIVPETGLLAEGGITGQAHQVCRNLDQVLRAAGSSLESAVKTLCFLADMADFTVFNEVYAQYFTGKPARDHGLAVGADGGGSAGSIYGFRHG